MAERNERASESKGLTCPQCGCRHFSVVYTRPRAEKIVRRKQCRNCGRHVLTYERVV
jgi:transcriptional regulator NrdR family protein